MAATPAFDHSWAVLDKPTPYLVMDLARVRYAHQRLSAALPTIGEQRALIFYAMKANSDPHVIRQLDSLGCGVEIASIGELEILRRIGVPNSADRVLYSNPIKLEEEIAAAYQAGVRQFTVDHADELRKIAEIAPYSFIYYRLRTRPGKSAVPSEGKFGASKDEIISMLKLTLSEYGNVLTPWGLSFHVGSEQININAWPAAIADAVEVAEAMYSFGSTLEQQVHFRIPVLNIGGGFPVPHPGLREVGLEAMERMLRDRMRTFPYEIPIVAEPGRFLVADAGIMVATVKAVVPRGEETWVYTDAGVFNCFMEVLETGHQLQYPVVASRGGRTARFNITGPTCDSQDTVMYNASLPADLRPKDRLYFWLSGAYTEVYSTDFNGFPRPQVYVVDTDFAPSASAVKPSGGRHGLHAVRSIT